jgi:hypothetical protein
VLFLRSSEFRQDRNSKSGLYQTKRC